MFMRKLVWIAVAVCLLSLPMSGQRRHGYTPAGGWHRKPNPTPPASRENKKRTDKRPPQTPHAR